MTMPWKDRQAGRAQRPGRLTAMLAALAVSGCVRLEAPDKPIVINLNIAIRQEVVYRLDSRAQELIQSEADIF
jgi:hypothetical protein